MTIPGICLSGGAEGADLQWGMCAGMAGHSVFHYSFFGHRSNAPDAETIVLTESQLNESQESVKKAAVWLSKHPPKKFPAKQLIARNFFQVRETERVYAITDIVDGIPTGGTAWAIGMYLLRTDLETKECYVYDQTQSQWFSYSDTVWVPIDSPPEPHGIWAGIGTRDLKKNGKDAIRSLLNYVGN